MTDTSGREVLVVPVARLFGSRWWLAFYALIAFNAVVQVLSRPRPLTWIGIGIALVAACAGVVVLVRQRRDPPRLVLDPAGIALEGTGVRRRYLAWGDVEDLRIHPPGGVRTVKLKPRGGAWQTWQSVTDDDVPKLTARWLAARGRAPA